jgi:hypothetical protein
MGMAVIGFAARCEHGWGECAKWARVRIKASNEHGILMWHRFFCFEHAGSLLENAPYFGLWVIDD